MTARHQDSGLIDPIEVSHDEAMAIIDGFETASDEGQLNAAGYTLLTRIAKHWGEEMFAHCPWLLRHARRPQLLIVHHDHDTPENRVAAEQALHERGVTEVRHQTAFNINENRVMLRSDGYA